jgi:hypothetical protein
MAHKIYSDNAQLHRIAEILTGYLKLPFTETTVPGALMEAVLANVRKGEVLRTYDFVDVIDKLSAIGWQVKSTKAATPLTWKRAKIRNRNDLIETSRKSAKGLQDLGDEIINFCNQHAVESLEKYNLNEIGFARLIVHDNDKLTYYERLLCSKKNPQLFNPADYSWKWAIPKQTKGKEQLPALHGTNVKTGKKVFAWHGLGENQLHFSGEKEWWPTNKEHIINFSAPSEDARLSYEAFADVLTKLTNKS